MELGDDLERELVFWECVEFCDRVAAIIVSCPRAQFYDMLATIQERHPAWPYFQQQLEVKKQLIEASGPDGRRLWRVLSTALDHGYEPPQARDWR
jgi:hypothetical protein